MSIYTVFNKENFIKYYDTVKNKKTPTNSDIGTEKLPDLGSFFKEPQAPIKKITKKPDSKEKIGSKENCVKVNRILTKKPDSQEKIGSKENSMKVNSNSSSRSGLSLKLRKPLGPTAAENKQHQAFSNKNSIKILKQSPVNKTSRSKEHKEESSISISCSSNKSVTEESYSQEEVDCWYSLAVPLIPLKDIEFCGDLGTIGEGSYGKVLKAKWWNMEVAVKKIKNNSPDSQRSTLNEIAVMERARNKYIVQIAAVCVEPSDFYILMDFIDGHNLKDALFTIGIRENYKLDYNEKIKISLPISTAVNYLHKREIIHRDLKPENIMVDKTKLGLEIKLCDYGLGKSQELPDILQSVSGNNFKGTLLYMPSETLICDQPATMAFDIWSLSCVIVDIFTGVRVWKIPKWSNINKKDKFIELMMKNKMPDFSEIKCEC